MSRGLNLHYDWIKECHFTSINYILIDSNLHSSQATLVQNFHDLCIGYECSSIFKYISQQRMATLAVLQNY